MVFLHGILDVTIQKASNLRNTEYSLFNKDDKSDPYVVVSLISEKGQKSDIAATSVKDDNLDPEWDERYAVDICHEVSIIKFTVHDKDLIGSKVIGHCKILPDRVISEGGVSGSFNLISEGFFTGSFKKKNTGNGTLFLSIYFIGKSFIPNKDSFEVPSCPFPSRPNNHLVLYQDAHCPYLPLQLIRQDNSAYVPRSTWRDIHTAITQAITVIYIVGWSVSVETQLLRSEGDDTRTLGEILKQKSQAGVQVKILLWDELTSNDTLPCMKVGVMQTEDNITLDFFKGTNVEVILQSIETNTSDMCAIDKVAGTLFKGFAFSHHQKTVITDAPITHNFAERKLIAFIGGLDLTAGRYDTPEHPLFRTLVNEHKDDFINHTLPNLTSSSGPRQPWHDIHSRVEGPTVRDILKNFEERWVKVKQQPIAIHTEKNINLDYSFQSWDSWSIQMFRSINDCSADMNSYPIKTAFMHALPSIKLKRGYKVDNSLYRAYIHHIRRAKSFIYIENQYFMGSRHMWPDSKDGKAGNLIPLEISIKIEEKIMNNECFVVYIVIPMYPEGEPETDPIQEMLYNQNQTIQMMYSRISKAIANSGRPSAHPQEYLLFLCLGSKELSSARPDSLMAPDQNINAMSYHNLRNMIYVHSKMGIFDDEYIIVGSANINDRSMSGNRDTEIAIGAYQPNLLANGDVSMFRKALWAEHLGINTPTDVWDHPGSPQCRVRVHELVEGSLQAYLMPGEHETPHHLMIYPLSVSQEGKVTARPDCECIPDTSAKVKGRMSLLPKILCA
ncbi:unnamed protein product [Meganyctiphanes norvegica]|uniref:phospholipase D n=1 Tax=Meganyctiphanes norvegica TaxID=48144 RepID=A0AAV2QVD4_MEGNR